MKMNIYPAFREWQSFYLNHGGVMFLGAFDLKLGNCQLVRLEWLRNEQNQHTHIYPKSESVISKDLLFSFSNPLILFCCFRHL